MKRQTDIYCCKCEKYLFTESESETGRTSRANDQENYEYDENKDEFVCNECKVVLLLKEEKYITH